MVTSLEELHLDDYRKRDTRILALCCPHCGDPNIHHGRVTVYSTYEGARDTAVTVISPGGNITSHRNGSGWDNPGTNRSGLAVHFTCECCAKSFELTLGQHKGHTHVEWRDAAPGPNAEGVGPLYDAGEPT
jgi:hypothetical protein